MLMGDIFGALLIAAMFILNAGIWYMIGRNRRSLDDNLSAIDRCTDQRQMLIDLVYDSNPFRDKLREAYMKVTWDSHYHALLKKRDPTMLYEQPLRGLFREKLYYNELELKAYVERNHPRLMKDFKTNMAARKRLGIGE